MVLQHTNDLCGSSALICSSCSAVLSSWCSRLCQSVGDAVSGAVSAVGDAVGGVSNAVGDAVGAASDAVGCIVSDAVGCTGLEPNDLLEALSTLISDTNYLESFIQGA